MEKIQAPGQEALQRQLEELSFQMRTPLQIIVGCAALAEQNRAD